MAKKHTQLGRNAQTGSFVHIRSTEKLQVEIFKQATKEFNRLANSSPSSAASTLRDEGIYTATGKISKKYK
jgi:hypothetical protein